MCHIYAEQDPRRYELTARSLRIEGHSTSIRLENAFWDVLERMAAAENRSLNDLIGAFHREVALHRDEPVNFTSVLRSCCLIFLETSGDAAQDDRAAQAA